MIGQIVKGGAPAKAFKATDAKLSKVGDQETETWNKLHISACADV